MIWGRNVVMFGVARLVWLGGVFEGTSLGDPYSIFAIWVGHDMGQGVWCYVVMSGGARVVVIKISG